MKKNVEELCDLMLMIFRTYCEVNKARLKRVYIVCQLLLKYEGIIKMSMYICLFLKKIRNKYKLKEQKRVDEMGYKEKV